MDNWTDIISKATYDYIMDAGIDSVDDLLLTKNLTGIILNEKTVNYNYKYNHKISLKENEKLVKDFLYNLNKDYLDYYEKIREEDIFVFDFNKEEDYPYSSYDFIKNKRIIYIPIYNNIEDSYSIVHELMHDINFDITGENIARHLFTESISILSELLLEDFFKNKNITQYRNPNNFSFYSVKSKAFEVNLNLKFIESYLNDNYLSKGNIIKILRDYTDKDLEDLNLVLSKIIDNEELTYEIERRYIIGFLMATYMYDRIKQNKNNIKELFELNEMLPTCYFEDVLDYLDLDYNEIELTNDSYEKLHNSYKKYLKSR